MPAQNSHVTTPSLQFPIRVEEAIVLDLLRLSDACTLFDRVRQNRDYLRQWLPWVEAVQQA